MNTTTPRPWCVWQSRQNATQLFICQGEAPDYSKPFKGHVIADISSTCPEYRANAEHIVRCVNSHDELLAACQQVLAVLPDLKNHGQYQTDAACATLVEAIAKSTGQ